MKFSGVLLAALFVAVVACADDVADGPDLTVVPDPITLQWGPVTVPPGLETVQCVNLRLGNDAPLKIREITNVLGDVSHHYIVYRSLETEEYATPRDCSSVENLVDIDSGVPLMITQKAEETLTLPDGVAFELAADQMIKLELHYVNATDVPADVQVVTTFVPMAEADFEQAADFVFIGNPDIEVPPGQTATLGPTPFPVPWELMGANVFGVTGHQHRWGTDVYVEVTDGQSTTTLYDLPDFQWDEPETVYHEPPVALPESGELRFTCEWFNGGNQTASFGEGVDDEMCFFWAYYYPSRGSLVCIHTEYTGDPLDVCCPGHQLCALVDEFFDR